MKLLVIDDSCVTRKIIRAALESEFEFTEAENRRSALDRFGEIAPDVVLLANTLTTDDCYALCVELRALDKSRGTPILLLGTSPEPAHYEPGFRAGASGFLVKPFRKEDLWEKIMQLSSRSSRRRGQTVLIAEDSRSVRMILRNALVNAGFEALEAEDGREALELIESRRVDLVSTDCQMPNMDGLELTEAIRGNARLSALPVLMLTSLSDPDSAERARASGVDAFLTKPFQPDAYVKAVSGLLARHEDADSYLIYCAEDALTDRNHLTRLLEKWGFRNEIFENGRRLMDRLEAAAVDRAGRPDLVLLDLFMPEMDGLQILRRIRADGTLADLPVIMISAFGNYERIAEAHSVGVNDFVVKPFVEEEVLARMRIHLRPVHPVKVEEKSWRI